MPKPSSYLEKVELKRFKAAFEPEPIPLKPFTVVIGRNGSGKSTLIAASRRSKTASTHGRWSKSSVTSKRLRGEALR